MNSTLPVNFVSWLERTTATLAEVVFPPVCAGCGRLGAILCDSCVARMVPFEGPLCQQCGRKITSQSPRSTHCCAACSAEPLPLTQVRAPFLYVEPTSTLIHCLKYEGYFALAKPLAGMMSRRWPVWERPVDLILPIPLHKRRQRRRGFNQSALLAGSLARDVAIEYDDNALHRNRDTPPQIELGPEARRDNVAGAFQADSARVSGRHVVLIDDVYTTGATMTAAADALIGAGAASISGFCLARVS